MEIIVFTDLDGTPLDRDSYSFLAAKPALAELRRLDVPLVLASRARGSTSRTPQPGTTRAATPGRIICRRR